MPSSIRASYKRSAPRRYVSRTSGSKRSFTPSFLFRLLPDGFSNAEVRERFEPLLGRRLTAGAVTYDLRRLRLYGAIRRIPRTHRYEVTQAGLRYALFFTRSSDRLLRPGLSSVLSDDVGASKLQHHFRQLVSAVAAWVAQAKLAS